MWHRDGLSKKLQPLDQKYENQLRINFQSNKLKLKAENENESLATRNAFRKCKQFAANRTRMVRFKNRMQLNEVISTSQATGQTRNELAAKTHLNRLSIKPKPMGQVHAWDTKCFCCLFFCFKQSNFSLFIK